jgi:hypothetical protein
MDNHAMAYYSPSYGRSPPAVLTLDTFRKTSSSTSKPPPHKSVDSARRRKGSARGKTRAKPLLSPLADFATRLVLDEKVSSHGKKEEAISGPSSYDPFELDFPEIKWILEDENEDNIFPFRFKGGSPEDFCLGDLVYQEQDPRVAFQRCLTLRKHRRSSGYLFRSKTVRRDLTGTSNP